MRITPGMTADNALYNLQKRRADMETLQEQIGSGVIVNRPSDDPLSTRQLLDLQNQIDAGDQYTSNITKGKLFLDVTNTALTGMSQLMRQVKDVVGTVTGGTTDAASLAAAADNLTELKKQLIDLGNTEVAGQYVFAGFGAAPPFAASGAFSGSNDDLSVEVAQGSRVAINVSGGELLRGGASPSSVPGGSPVDILGSLDGLIQAIGNKDSAGIIAGGKNMDAAAAQVEATQANVAGRLVRLDNMKGMIASHQNTLKGIYGDMQNVDYAKVGVELGQQTTAFNAALSATAKLSELSLLDYMK